jgi:CoA-transferase family III
LRRAPAAASRPTELTDAARSLDDAAARLGAELGVDGVALLHERAQILGVAPSGTISAGGTCRLLPARDGRWVAINLTRRSDVELLGAWMGHEWDGAPWDAVSEHLATVDADPAVARAQLLGIPAAVAVAAARGASPVRVRPGPATTRGGAPMVLDCSALWAGPLCARLLAGTGAQVSKVELVGRPDGARAGPPEFWRRLNGDKHEVTVERDALPALIDGADVVVTSARPRAIEQIGLDLARRVREDGLLWISISGYGFESEWRDRVAFGDDAAVAGGLAVAAGGPDAPVFVGDAPADPLAGMHAARAALDLVHHGRGGFVDVSMRDAVAHAVTSGNYGRDVRTAEVSVRGAGTLRRSEPNCGVEVA